ncbi:MAG TPA: hypothetical protein VFT55_17040, partial [Planctomycetota bacterium]|nr:hypothetical protein [Planctomycetota bacterium]
LGFPDEDDVRIFIPDTHFITPATIKKMGYRSVTNDVDLLARTMLALATLKADSAATVAIYQLGDFMDLWRESLSGADPVIAADKIAVAYPDVMQAFDDARVRFVFGNHDYDLRRIPRFVAWNRRYYLPDLDSRKPSVMITHGDVFDWLERSLPDDIQRFFVYYFAPLFSANDYDLRAVEDTIRKCHGKKKYLTKIQGTADIGPVTDPEQMPRRFNVKSDGVFFQGAKDACRKANAQFGLDLRIAVIGHTHHARMVAEEDGDQLFLLMDCGAWIEKCRIDGFDKPVPSAQVGVLAMNDARIYQLLRKA